MALVIPQDNLSTIRNTKQITTELITSTTIDSGTCIDEHDISHTETWRASFLEKARRVGHLVHHRWQTKSCDVSNPNAQQQSGSRRLLWQAIEVNYHYAQDWRLVVDCALTAQTEMLRSGPWAQWGEMLKLALDAAQRLEEEESIARILYASGRLYHRQGLWKEAEIYYQEAEKLYTYMDDPIWPARIWCHLAEQYYERGDRTRAESYIERARVTQETEGDALGLSATYSVLGHLAWMRNDTQIAIDWCKRALSIHAMQAEPETLSRTHSRLGNLYSGLNQYEEALTHYAHSRTIAERIGDDGNLNIVLLNLGVLYTDMGALTQSLAELEQARLIAERCGDRHSFAIIHINKGNAYLDFGQMERALSEYSAAIDLLRQLEDVNYLGYVLGYQSEVYRELGELENVEQCLEEAEQVLLKLDPNISLRSSLLRERGKLAAARQEWHRAIELLAQSFELAVESEGHLRQVEAALGIAQVYLSIQEWSSIPHWLEHVRALAHRLEHWDWLGRAEQLAGDAEWAQGNVKGAINAYGAAHIALAQKDNDRNRYLTSLLMERTETIRKEYPDLVQVYETS